MKYQFVMVSLSVAFSFLGGAAQAQSGSNSVGQVARSIVGVVGQRQGEREADALKPMARISNRVQNRIRLRMSNRIDRNYDPQGNVASSFLAAEDRTRKAVRPR